MKEKWKFIRQEDGRWFAKSIPDGGSQEGARCGKALCWGRGAADGAPERTAVLMEPRGDRCGANPGRGRPSRQGLWERGGGGLDPRSIARMPGGQSSVCGCTCGQDLCVHLGTVRKAYVFKRGRKQVWLWSLPTVTPEAWLSDHPRPRCGAGPEAERERGPGSQSGHPPGPPGPGHT